jgi:hypothetical protein
MSKRNKNMMQVYWVDADDGVARAKPGQFVHKSNADDNVCGFIGKVDTEQKRVMIYLFEPAPVQSFATVEREHILDEELLMVLKELLDADPQMKANWQVVMNNGVARN